MALDRQIHLYSVDTSFFYSSREAYLHRMNQRYRQEHRYLRERALEYETLLTEYGYSLKDLPQKSASVQRTCGPPEHGRTDIRGPGRSDQALVPNECPLYKLP